MPPPRQPQQTLYKKSLSNAERLSRALDTASRVSCEGYARHVLPTGSKDEIREHRRDQLSGGEQAKVKPVELCSGICFIPGENDHTPRSHFGASGFRGSDLTAASVETVHAGLAEMEAAAPDKGGTIDLGKEDRLSRKERDDSPAVQRWKSAGKASSFETKTFGQMTDDFAVSAGRTADEAAVISRMSSARIQTQKEESKAARAKRRLALQKAADTARGEFGLTSAEKRQAHTPPSSSSLPLPHTPLA